MPRTCTICGHEQRRRIEAAMLEQAPLRDIARRWGVSKDAASRHRKDHIPKAVIQGPCDHEDYRRDDSWTEELAFTGREFDSALRRIGTKVTAGKSKAEAMEDNLVVYWTDSSRRTSYLLRCSPA